MSTTNSTDQLHQMSSKCLMALTSLINGCALLVHRCAQSWCPDIQQPNFIHPRIKNSQNRVFVIFIVAHNLIVNKGCKHLGLQESWEERQVRFRLVRQERSLRDKKRSECEFAKRHIHQKHHLFWSRMHESALVSLKAWFYYTHQFYPQNSQSVWNFHHQDNHLVHSTITGMLWF